jgi:hypothetical protein
MPVQSEAQRRYLNVHFGHDWVKRHHFDQKGKLPERVGKATSSAASHGGSARDRLVRQFAKGQKIRSKRRRHPSPRRPPPRPPRRPSGY